MWIRIILNRGVIDMACVGLLYTEQPEHESAPLPSLNSVVLRSQASEGVQQLPNA